MKVMPNKLGGLLKTPKKIKLDHTLHQTLEISCICKHLCALEGDKCKPNTKNFFYMTKHFISMNTSVVCAIGPKWSHWGLNWFFLLNPIFVICLNFQQQNPFKNQYLPPGLSSKNCEINAIKPHSSRAFQQHLKQFSVSILFSFHGENGSIINSFHTIAPDNIKPSQCNPFSLRAFQRYQECDMKHHGLRETKQNKLPCFIGRLQVKPMTKHIYNIHGWIF